jgi:hypothetical protein
MTIAPASGLAPVETSGSQDRLGWDSGQPALYETWGVPSPYPKRALSSGNDGLPELAEDKVVARRMWRHPAFIVSIATTLLAVGTAVVMLLGGAFSSGVPAVTDLAITGGEGNVHLTWAGPDSAYSLYVIQAGSDEATDVSQLVRGTEAWVPLYADLIDSNSCFVVRSVEVTSTTIDTDAATLEEQGAATICVDDADA